MIRNLALAVLLIAALSACKTQAQSCTLAITGPLNFGTYTGAQIRSSTPFTVTCPGGSWYIPFNAGTGAGASETTRYLTGPNGAELAYEIYQNSAYSTNWGNSNPSTTYNGTGNYSGYVYAQLNANQTVAPGTYTDTISSDTTSFTLTVTILANCTITANPLAFGNYTGALLQAKTSVNVTCTSGATYTVGLNAGTATGATVTARKMTGPSGALLNYALFSNSGYSTNWGNSSGSWVAGTGTGAAQTLYVYGQIAAGQYPVPGSYTDTVTATLTY